VVRRRVSIAGLAALAALGVACGGEPAAEPPYERLSQYGFFAGNGSTQEPVAGVIPFTVNASLFADFADKHRFIVLPPGEKITYSADGNWRFPPGAMIIKTFAYGARVIETRVLIRRGADWLPTVYLWDAAQTDATLALVGARVPVVARAPDGTEHEIEYRVPNQNQCFGCHGPPGSADVLGLRTRQVNRDHDYGQGPENQIDHLERLGLFAGPLPPREERARLPDPYLPGEIEPRARAWLEANCAHCHSPDGAAASTNLWLNVDVTRAIDLGVCRLPNAAGAGTGGRRFDIVPGLPDESIMIYRIESTDPDIKMPEMPIQLVDPDGVALISAWIAAMTPVGCGP
jgi:uncharacterized repeat protein (TIGR03806 family)